MFKFKNNMMSEEDIIVLYINEFNSSKERELMITGQKYYDAENDVLNRKMLRFTNAGYEEDNSKANNKLVHAFAKNLVDEKTSYLLSKPLSLKSENKEYVKKVEDVLGKYFQYELSGTGVESSNKGKAYWYIYVDEEGKFKYLPISAEQGIPIWTDNTHTELQAFIRYYVQVVYEGRNKKEVTKVEYYTSDFITYYEMVNDKLIIDIEVNPEGVPQPHFIKGGDAKSWGKVPIIVFKNNRREFPDIKYIKSLIDDYDLKRSDISNVLEECKNFIYVLKNYGGQDLSEFLKDLNYYRAIKVDDDGGVDALTPKIDVEAVRLHLEQTKRDINEFGQSVNKDLDKFGSAPSGIALKFLYSGLDLKCNKLEEEFKKSFEQLLYFVNIYLGETGQSSNSNDKIEIVFNRDIAINETETISNVMNSKGVISNKTIVANHPWVTNVDDELAEIAKDKAAAIKEQQEAFGMPMTSKVNTNEDEE